jgi:tetratricopeptide (TPR) repeat protein
MCFMRVVQIAPDNIWGHYNMGLLRATDGQHDAAIGFFHQVIDLEPKLALTYQHLADSLRALGRTDEAVAMQARFDELK